MYAFLLLTFFIVAKYNIIVALQLIALYLHPLFHTIIADLHIYGSILFYCISVYAEYCYVDKGIKSNLYKML